MRRIIQTIYNLGGYDISIILVLIENMDDNIIIDEVIRFYNAVRTFYKTEYIARFLNLAVSTVYNFNVLLKKNDYNINPDIRKNRVYEELSFLYELIKEVHKDEK